MPTRKLPSTPPRTRPDQPDLAQLKRQAKELLEGFKAGHADAVAEVNAHYHDARAERFALHDAQLVIARAYGFESWPKLKDYVDEVTIARLVDAVCTGDAERVRAILHARPDLAKPRDDRGWLLRIAVDHDRPEILKLLLDLKLDPDARVHVEGEDESSFTWGMPLYQCTRNNKHVMAQMLLERGADPNGQVYASGTPLSEAYGQRNEEMIARLERFGGKSNASMAGLYRRIDLARRLLDQHGDTPLPDDGFSSGPVAEQLLGAAARGGDPEILRMALERVAIPHGDRRWNGLLQAPLKFWNHGHGPWCHHEWDRGTYLECFKMILERCGPPNAPLKNGATILHLIAAMADHVTNEERVAFATAALDAGARLDLRDEC